MATVLKQKPSADPLEALYAEWLAARAVYDEAHAKWLAVDDVTEAEVKKVVPGSDGARVAPHSFMGKDFYVVRALDEELADVLSLIPPIEAARIKQIKDEAATVRASLNKQWRVVNKIKDRTGYAQAEDAIEASYKRLDVIEDRILRARGKTPFAAYVQLRVLWQMVYEDEEDFDNTLIERALHALAFTLGLPKGPARKRRQ